MNEPAKIAESDLKKVKDGFLNFEQLKVIIEKTPLKYQYKRKGKGGEYTYVTGSYIKKVLNMVFGWDWDFEIADQLVNMDYKQVVVKGRLTVRVGSREVVKEQFGRADIKFRKQTTKELERQDTKVPVDVGNDMKAAATDALKKCASELGIASDIYAPNEFKQIELHKDEATMWKTIEIEQLMVRSGLDAKYKERIEELLQIGITEEQANDIIRVL